LEEIPEDEECHELEHECVEDCAFQCEKLVLDHFEYGSCEPGEFKDHMLTVTEDMLKYNYVFEVEDLSETITPDALSAYLYEDNIPIDRHTENRQMTSSESIWSLAISYHDIEAHNYFFSVKCGPEPKRFRVLARAVPAVMHDGDLIHGEVCPGLWTYHSYMHDDPDHPVHVKMSLMLHTGDLHYLTRHEHPPLKLVPPYGNTDALEQMMDHHATDVYLCNLEAGNHYLGLLGGDHCAEYEVGIEVLDAAAYPDCAELEETEETLASEKAHKLSFGHFELGSCEPGAYEDFFIHIDADESDSNVVFEVEDLTDPGNPEAIALFLYPDKLPKDHKTERFSDYGHKGLYSVAVNSHDLHAGDYFVAVRCGAHHTQFRILAELIPAKLVDDGHVAGVVCPGELIYHHYFYSSDPNATAHHGTGAHRRRALLAGAPSGGDSYNSTEFQNVKFTLKLHTGDLRYLTSHGVPPLKLIPPYQTTSAVEQFAAHEYDKIGICNIKHGESFIALMGVSECAEYDIYLEEIPEDEECHELEHECVEDCAFQCEKLVLDHFEYGSCEPGEFKDHMLTVTEDMLKYNYVFEVEDLSETITPDALSAYLYEDNIPIDRHTENRQMTSSESIWSLAISYHDIEAHNYFFSVKCGPEPKRFRVLARAVPAVMHDGDLIHGEVCPGLWTYHSYMHDDPDHPVHVKMSLMLHTGDLHYLTRHEHPPLKLVPPYGNTDALEQMMDHHATDVYLCNLEAGNHYLGLLGGDHCAEYEVGIEVLDAAAYPDCAELEETEETLASEKAHKLSFGHFELGSCEPGAYEDFFIHIDADESDSNVVFEVEDLTDPGNPEAIALFLYPDKLPKDHKTERFSDYGHKGLYSVAVNSHDLHAGDYFVAVRCGAHHTQFRILAELIPAKLVDDGHVAGVVCPGEFIYHHIDIHHDHVDLSFEIKVHTGDLFYLTGLEYPPLRLIPPFAHTSAGKQLAMHVAASANVCNIHETGEYYLGLRGGSVCAEYDLYAYVNDHSDSCVGIQQDASIANYHDHHLHVAHFTLGSCEAGETVDYVIEIDEEDSEKNMIIEVELLDDEIIFDAVLVRMYGPVDSIPIDRKTEYFNDFSSENLWTVSLSEYDLKPGKYYVTVMCKDAFRSFRILPLLIASEVHEGHHVHGEVCPGDWVYHKAVIPMEFPELQKGNSVNIRWFVEMHKGSLFYTTRPSERIIKLERPYLRADTNFTEVLTYEVAWCQVNKFATDTYYLSLRGADKCASYEVTYQLEEVPFDRKCMDNIKDESLYSAAAHLDELEEGHYTYGSCAKGAFFDYSIHIPLEEAYHFSLTINVEDLTDGDDPNRLEVFMFKDEIPADRYSDAVETSNNAVNKMYSVGADALQMEGGMYYASVRCKGMAARFRITALEVPLSVPEFLPTTGSVPPGKWMFHSHTLLPDRVGTGVTSMTFNIMVNTGDIYMAMMRSNGVPAFTTRSYNRYMKKVSGESFLTLTFCNSSADEPVYIALYGGEELASYLMYVTLSKDSKCDTVGLPGYAGTSAAPRTHGSALFALVTLLLALLVG